MSATEAVFPCQRKRVRLLVWGGLAGAVAMAALWPYAFLFEHFALASMVGAGIVGYVPGRSKMDALWFACAAAAVAVIEPGTATRVLVVLALPCFVLTLRPRFAIAAALSLMALLLGGTRLKLRFAGSRLTWQDLRFFFLEFRDNASVFQSQPTFLLYAGALLLALAAVLWAAWAWDGRKAGAPVRRHSRAAAVLLAAVVVGTSASALADDVARVRGIGPWNNSVLSQIPAFPFAHFLHTATLRTAWAEPQVPTARFAQDVRAHMGGASASRPADIVLFLQESQFNPATVQDCPPDVCTLPVFAADETTRAYGPLRVHTFGGGTWLSEFAAATGVPHTAFGEGGAYAPFTVAPGLHRSIPRSLRAAGYRTVALNPLHGGVMNARNAYQAYGYDAYYDARDLGINRGFGLTDHDMHAAALRVLERERRHGKPVLLTVVTIFNHSQHGVHLERVPAHLLATMRARFADPQAADVIADYVWRTGEFQAAMQHTAQALLGGPEPVVLAWFGDHQPPGAAEFNVRSADGGGRLPVQFQTWYRVISNVPDTAASTRAQPLDIVFLGGLIAQAAHAPLDEMLAANVAAREQCGGLLRECARPEARDAYLSYLRQDLAAYDVP